jgi:hypothetical protein
MAYARTAERHDFVAASPSRKHGRGFFRRLFDALVEGRRRTADREIAAFLEGHGKYLTDDAEREIERILSSSPRF